MKSCKVDFKVRHNRLLLWLIVLLTIVLIITVGVFVFLSVDSKHRLSCLFSCEKQENTEALVGISPSASTHESTRFSEILPRTEKPTDEGIAHTVIDKNGKHDPISRSRTQPTVTSAGVNRKSRPSKKSTPGRKKSTPGKNATVPTVPVNFRTTTRNRRNFIKITGEISFKSSAPKRFPPKSRLIVEFQDITRQDAPSVLLGKTSVDLAGYRRKRPLRYVIECKRPKMADRFYSVSAVLNVGWRATKKRWIRNGDYLTVSTFSVQIEDDKRSSYERNIELVYYG